MISSPVLLSVNTRSLRGPHLLTPSAFPQTRLTVSFSNLFKVIVIRAPVDVVLIVLGDANGDYASEISAGFNDVKKQSQFERMLAPAIAKVMSLPGFLTVI